jgi:hypothetical protein
MRSPDQHDATSDSCSSHDLAILSIALAGSLGCAAATAQPSIHPAPGPEDTCAIAGHPHARAYTAVVETAEGGSAFEDRAVCLEERVLFGAGPPDETVQLSAAGGVLFLRSGPYDLPPHQAPRRQWVVPLRGAFQVTVTDGTSRRFGPGDLILVTDTTGSGHTTVSIGAPPFEVLFVPAESPRR